MENKFRFREAVLFAGLAGACGPQSECFEHRKLDQRYDFPSGMCAELKDTTGPDASVNLIVIVQENTPGGDVSIGDVLLDREHPVYAEFTSQPEESSYFCTNPDKVNLWGGSEANKNSVTESIDLMLEAIADKDDMCFKF